MRRLLAACACLMIIAGPALAWTDQAGVWHNDITNNNNPQAFGGMGGQGGKGGSASQSQQQRLSARQANQQTTNINGAAIPSNTTGRYAVSNVPDVVAPSISSGTTCVLATSLGLSWLGFGASAGQSYPEKQCELRMKAAVFWNMGDYDTAVALMCQDDDSHKAINAHGGTCPGDPKKGVVDVGPISQTPHPDAPPSAIVPIDMDACSARPGWTKEAAQANYYKVYKARCPN